MEKKKIWIVVCASVVAAAVIGIAIFLIVTSSVQPTSPTGAPENIDGTWRVAAFTPNVAGDNVKAIYVDDEQMVLKDGTFSYYQNGTVIATAKYTFTSGAKDYSSTISVPHYRCSLDLKEWSLDGLPTLLVVKYYTENIVEFVDEMSGKMWRLVHTDGTTEQEKVTAEYLRKKWTVVLKGYQAPDMTLEFAADKVKVERAEGPMELPYTFDAEKQTLDIPAFGLAHLIIPSENKLAFALEEKTQEITLWELKLA